MLISPEYLVLQRELHERSRHYGTSGKTWAEAVAKFADVVKAASILDYGAGKGTLADLFVGEDFREFDPAVPGKDTRPEPADLVVCGDVLEHIEPVYLESVLDDLRKLARKGVFLVIGTVPAMKTLADGRNAHLIVESSRWWLPRLMERWSLSEFRDYGPAFQCTMTVR